MCGLRWRRLGCFRISIMNLIIRNIKSAIKLIQRNINSMKYLINDGLAEKEEQIEKLTRLKIIDYRQDWYLRLEADWTFKYFCVFSVISSIIFIIMSIFLTKPTVFNVFLYLAVFFTMVCTVTNTMIRLYLRIHPIASIVLTAIIFPLIFLWPLNKFNEVDNFWILVVLVLVLVFMISSTIMIIKKMPRYFYNSLKEVVDVIILGLLSIITLIKGADFLGVDNILDKLWSLFVICFTTMMVCLKIYFEYHSFLKKRHLKSKLKVSLISPEKMFESILLFPTPSSDIERRYLYNKMKFCYFYGGDEYKDKMLTNEKMLRVIRHYEP